MPHILAEDPESLRGWMLTVARHLVVDDVRSARRRHQIVVAELSESAGADDAETLLDGILIEDALRTLTDDHRAVIVHAYYLGRSVTQTAAALGIPEGTAKSRLHYGVRALRSPCRSGGVTR